MRPASGRRTGDPSPRHAALAGFAALFIGIGLARFGYPPLLPAVIEFGWFPPAGAVWLGAANFAGYLVGAVCAWKLTVPWSPRTTLRALLAATALSFAASALPLSFAWMLCWRFLPGLTGGWIMVLTAPLILTAIPRHRQRQAGGLLFAGVASGMIASGTLVPLLLGAGLATAWLGIAAMMAAGLAIAWNGIPARAADPPPPPAAGGLERRMTGLVAAYGLYAFAIGPTILLLVDHVARGMGHGIPVGSLAWILVGAGGIAGPVLTARVAGARGLRRTLQGSYLALAAGTLAVALTGSLAVTLAAALFVGGLITAISSLTLASIGEMEARRDRQTRSWGIATATFAVAQTVSAWGAAWLYAHGVGTPTLFLLAALAGLLGFLVLLLPAWRPRR